MPPGTEPTTAESLTVNGGGRFKPAAVYSDRYPDNDPVMLIPVPTVLAALAAQPVDRAGAVGQIALPPAMGVGNALEPASELRSAQQLIAQGSDAQARTVLEALAAGKLRLTRQQANQLDFLLGLLDLAEKDYEGAIHHFHRILVTEPKAVRIRLELGRAYFFAKDYVNAERQFLYARAGNVPSAVQRNIDHYLNAIRSLRTFSFNFALSLAADSDVNAGPATDTISIYGLPFKLSQQARANSGIGMAIDGGAQAALRLDSHLKWRIGMQLHRSQYRDTLYDDMTINGYAGPHLTLKRWDLDLIGNIGRRWYGDRVYADMSGVTASATYYMTGRLGLGGGLNLTHFTYPQNHLDDGWGGTVSANLFYTPTVASIVRIAASRGKQGADDPTWANQAQQYSVSYTREFAGGITVSLLPAFTRIDYRAAIAAFGVARMDRQFSGQITLLDRKLDWHGLTPRLVYSYTHNNSSIPLYTFQRSRLEAGITRAF